MRYLIASLLIFCLASCGNPEPKKSPRKELQKKVMAIHDEVMPKMGDIMKLKKELNAAYDTSGSDSLKTILMDNIKTLEQADEAMMQWMRNYNPPSNEMPDEDAMAYLKQEEVKIVEVKDAMLSSIEQAKEVLK